MIPSPFRIEILAKQYCMVHLDAKRVKQPSLIHNVTDHNLLFSTAYLYIAIIKYLYNTDV